MNECQRVFTKMLIFSFRMTVQNPGNGKCFFLPGSVMICSVSEEDFIWQSVNVTGKNST